MEVPPLFLGETREVVLEPLPTLLFDLFRGVVVDDAGQPLPGAHVGLFPMEGDEPGRDAITAVETDEFGQFSLYRSEGPCLLVAATRGRRPASLRVDGAAPRHGIWLVLERGFALSGVVRKNGRPEAGVQLRVDLAYFVAGLFGCGPELFWKEGRVETKHGIARTGVDGRYEMTGLGPYVHRLDLSGSETVNVEVPSFRDFDLIGRRP